MSVLSIFRRKKQPVKRSAPKVDKTLHLYAESVLAEVRSTFPLSYEPILEWRRYSVTAGMAHFQQGKISLSSIVLKENDHVRETLLHEYAHLLAFDRHGRKGTGHGKHWKQAMIDLGLEPKTHHHYEVVRNKSHQVVIYKCKKCGTQFGRKRKLSTRKKYMHRQCGGQIALVEVQRATTQTETA